MEKQEHANHQVRIHIDRKPYESPSPTTGAALYALGQVAAHRELFREVSGDHEDEEVHRDAASITLRQDEHFYSEKDFNIIVNGRKRQTTSPVLSFEDVVALAFEKKPAGQNILFTISYRNGPRKNPEGSLIAGGHVKIKDGMIFNVTPTDKS